MSLSDSAINQYVQRTLVVYIPIISKALIDICMFLSFFKTHNTNFYIALFNALMCTSKSAYSERNKS